eukprot:TRINITY_DN10449_c0_g1_i1.p1 TRINITY_DN10449_c0_g1~~TRINITY_DN10449_c0_g1_i1.p1  ORF type:complete len:55 (+),score=0.94 TRINITY_DN10449_c0_g1_i1:145-309(+)
MSDIHNPNIQHLSLTHSQKQSTPNHILLFSPSQQITVFFTGSNSLPYTALVYKM